jgi:hypothetical protein
MQRRSRMAEKDPVAIVVSSICRIDQVLQSRLEAAPTKGQESRPESNLFSIPIYRNENYSAVRLTAVTMTSNRAPNKSSPEPTKARAGYSLVK